MAGFSPKSITHYHVRSISFPARSHPSTIKAEEELNKLKTWEAFSSPKADTICNGLSGLEEVFECIEELLSLPVVQQALAQHQHETLVNELLEGSIRYIDICSNIRDTVLLMKEGVRELQSALRRSKAANMSIESNVNAYVCSRKRMRKEFEKSLVTLKNIENKLAASSLLDIDSHLLAVVRVLREASLVTISILQSLLLFLSVLVLKPKPSRWSLLSKLVQKGGAASVGEQNNMNEVESADIALRVLLLQSSSEDGEEERIQSAHRRLEDLDAVVGHFENGLEGLFRCLIHTRVSLLNILSC
ncbi:uncharacterized protein LOC132316301 [Cornus florida]|uniref:uncharacterized protein LOC132316301 n=1 Tax=Cornus florida TaxID=4283 RepID=UPI0028964142|nr:uncharacterized protein LOC132316301 [Cornus florida]